MISSLFSQDKMMNKQNLLSNLKGVESIANHSKLRRMLKAPIRYVNSIAYRELRYKKTQKSKEVKAKTFFGVDMSVLLPASTDIFITGGKSHHSEIRLARFLIHQLNPGDVFIDVGAHYGYFSLLAAHLVGQQGKVIGFEASPTTFEIVQKNQALFEHLQVINAAISDSNTPLSFYEFPNLYSEYNTLDIEQFKQEEWFKEQAPKEINIQSIILDEFLSQKQLEAKLIKIDVEGAEDKVIRGLQAHLSEYSPIVVMEYLSIERGGHIHEQAEKMLKKLAYQPHYIRQDGSLTAIENASEFINRQEEDSDNIVFIKQAER